MVQATEAKASPPKKAAAVLRLTTRADETIGRVSIDGRPYELANPEHFGLREGGRISRAISRIAELEGIAELRDPTPEEDAEYRAALLQVSEAALPDAPASALAKLKTGALSDLVVHFFAEVASRNPRLRSLLPAAPAAPRRRTGTT